MRGVGTRPFPVKSLAGEAGRMDGLECGRPRRVPGVIAAVSLLPFGLRPQVAEGVDTALALADLIKKIDKSYRIDLKYAIIFGGERPGYAFWRGFPLHVS